MKKYFLLFGVCGLVFVVWRGLVFGVGTKCYLASLIQYLESYKMKKADLYLTQF
jgi:hypothetical protein